MTLLRQDFHELDWERCQRDRNKEGGVTESEMQLPLHRTDLIETRPRDEHSLFVYYSYHGGTPQLMGVLYVDGDDAWGYYGHAWQHEGVTCVAHGPRAVTRALRGLALAHTG